MRQIVDEVLMKDYRSTDFFTVAFSTYSTKLKTSFAVSFDFPFFLFVNVIGVSVTFAPWILACLRVSISISYVWLCRFGSTLRTYSFE